MERPSSTLVMDGETPAVNTFYRYRRAFKFSQCLGELLGDWDELRFWRQYYQGRNSVGQWQGGDFPNRVPQGFPSSLSAHLLHTRRRWTPPKSQSDGPGWLMPDQPLSVHELVSSAQRTRVRHKEPRYFGGKLPGEHGAKFPIAGMNVAAISLIGPAS